MVIQDVATMLREIGISVHFVATHEMHVECITPSVAFKEAARSDSRTVLFLTTWGPLVETHIRLIRDHVPSAHILHYAQSFGWNAHIPEGTPIACVSRYVMSQFALHKPGHPLFVIPPYIHSDFSFSDSPRDIDILVHLRKQNLYCINHLLPALEHTDLDVEIIKDWIPQEKFASLLKRSKLFLYITEHHKAGWFKKLPGEGFGLPALEAASCGTIVASNLLGGVTDFLTPGENCVAIEGDVIHDIAKIKKIVGYFSPNKSATEHLRVAYSRETIKLNWTNVLGSIQ